jgi:hypothetical protein
MPTVTIEQIPEDKPSAGLFVGRVPSNPPTRVAGRSRALVMSICAQEASAAFPGEEITFVDVPWVYRPEEDVKPEQPEEQP